MHILIFEDSASDAGIIKQLLKHVDGVSISCDVVHRLATGLERLSDQVFDVILVDLGLPDCCGVETVESVLSRAPETALVVLTGMKNDETALRAVQLGAQDYLVKGQIDTEVLWRSIRYAIERKRLEQDRLRAHARNEQLLDSLKESELRFRQVLENIHEIVWMREIEGWKLLYVSPAYERIWGRTCESLHENPNDWIDAIHPRDRDRVTHAFFDKFIRGEFNEEYRIVRRDGTVRWIWDRGVPIRNESGDAYRVAGIAQDITDRKNLEKEILEVTAQEQLRIGQELHDGLGQEMTGISFMAKSLAQKLTAKSLPEAESALTILHGVQQAMAELGGVVRGLSPVDIDGCGLTSALEELAANTFERCRIECQFRCDEAVPLNDKMTATHLFRIAQEAVNNAIKYAKPRRIHVNLSQHRGCLALEVRDDGIGIATRDKDHTGMGLQIMQYRAGAIGADLDIESGSPMGTVVTCRLKRDEEWKHSTPKV